MTNLYRRLEACFPDDRNTLFVKLPGGETLSYGEAEAASARYANALGALGVVAGDRVAIQVRKNIEMVLLYLGCLRAGAVLLPLNTAYVACELQYFLDDAEPTLVVCDPADAASIAGLVGDGCTVQTIGGEDGGTLPALARAQSGRFETVACEDDDLAATLYTSGTTGRSKGAMLSHGNLASNALTLRHAWRFTADDVLLHALPIFHTHGLFVATNVVLASGASMIFLPEFQIDAMIEWIGEATVMMGVPTFYTRLLADGRFTRELAAHMRLFISGSAPLPADVHEEFRERTGHAILERYGMTETNMSTSNPYEGDRVAGTVGPPLPGVSVRITDPETGAVLPQGEIGMIEINGPNVFRGYWRMPERTASEFRDGYFISGDLGFIDERGYVSIVGRQKDLIIAGGFNIYPAEVEKAIASLPMVREVAVIGLPHPDLGEGVAAVVVPREPVGADAEALLAGLRGRLARFKQPRAMIFVDSLPKNAMGKVQKAALREQYRDRFQGEPKTAGRRAPAEPALQKLRSRDERGRGSRGY